MEAHQGHTSIPKKVMTIQHICTVTRETRICSRLAPAASIEWLQRATRSVTTASRKVQNEGQVTHRATRKRGRPAQVAGDSSVPFALSKR